MSARPWEAIDGFRSPGEFQRFLAWMGDQVAAGAATEVPVTTSYAGVSTFEERWFRFTKTGETWRLVSPDPPFTGVFEPV
jgi:hypothetical protein